MQQCLAATGRRPVELLFDRGVGDLFVIRVAGNVVDTDEIFTVLMGEEVEPRKEFIQSNALEVSTLDI